MSDYNLGTAHGKIVVDYEDKGNKKALVDMEKLKAKAASVATQMSQVRKRWYADTHAMASDVQRWSKNLGLFTGAAYLASAGMIRFSQGINGIKGASNIFSSLGLSMGMVPKGAEKFPKVILDIIRLTAAVGLIQHSLGLIGQLGAKFSTLRVGGPIFRAIGAAVSALGLNVLGLSKYIGGLGARFRSLSIFNPVFFAMQKAVASLGININGLGKNISRMTLGLAPMARAPGIMGALSGAIGKAAGPFRLVSGLALSLAGTIAELNIAKKLIKPLLGMQGALGGLGYAIQLAHSLGAEITRLAGLIPIAVGGLFVMAAAAGIAMIGFKGLGDAIKSGDISKLAPEAGQAVTAIRGLKGEFDSFKKSIQGAMFAGIGAEISGLKGKLSEITGESKAVAGGFNEIMKQVIGFAKAPTSINMVRTILSQTAGVLHNLSLAVAPFLNALFTIGTVGSGVFNELTKGISGSAVRFDQFIQNAAKSGQLEAWMKRGVQSIKDLWNALKALKGVWDTVRNALSPGGVTPFFAALKNGAEAMDRFLKSANGQRVLAIFADLIARAQDHLGRLADVFVSDILPAIEAFLPYMQALSEGAIEGLILGIKVLSPLFEGLGKALSFLAPVFEPIMASMVKTVVIIGGLLILLKIAGTAIFMLKYALDTLKMGWNIAAFGARLLTGNLKKGEASALRFAKTLIGNMLRALWATVAGFFKSAAAAVVWVAKNIWAAVTTVAKWIWAKTVMVAQWLWMAVQAVANAIRIAVVWVAQTIYTTVMVVARWVWARVQLILGWLLIRVASILSAIAAFVTWAVQAAIQTAAMIAQWVIARVRLIVEWLIIKVASLIQAITTFIPWAIQATIQTTLMVAAWVGAKIRLVVEWLLLKVTSLINAITAFIPWAIQSTIATAQMVLAWMMARIRLMVEWILMKVTSMINAITTFIPWLIQSTITTIQLVATWIMARIQLMINWVMMAVQSMMNAIRVGIAWIIANAPALASVAMAVIAAIMYIAQWVIMAIGAMANAIMMAAAWFVALGPVGWVIAIVIGLVILIIANWDKIKSWTINTFNTVSEWISTKINQAKAIVSSVLTAIANFFSNAWNRAKSITISVLAAVVGAVASGIARVVSFVSSLPGKIGSFFASAGRWLVNAGRAILEGLLNGLKAAWDAVAGWVSGIAGKIAALKGPLPKDRKLLIPAGLAIMQGLAIGLKTGFKTSVQPALKDITKTIANSDMGAPGVKAMTAPKNGWAAGATNAAISTWNPYDRPTGAGVGEQQTINDYGGFTVTIDAKSVAEMQNVVDFFDTVTQTARAGKADS